MISLDTKKTIKKKHRKRIAIAIGNDNNYRNKYFS